MNVLIIPEMTDNNSQGKQVIRKIRKMLFFTGLLLQLKILHICVSSAWNEFSKINLARELNFIETSYE